RSGITTREPDPEGTRSYGTQRRCADRREPRQEGLRVEGLGDCLPLYGGWREITVVRQMRDGRHCHLPLHAPHRPFLDCIACHLLPERQSVVHWTRSLVRCPPTASTKSTWRTSRMRLTIGSSKIVSRAALPGCSTIGFFRSSSRSYTSQTS